MTDPAVPPRPPLPSDPSWAQGYAVDPSPSEAAAADGHDAAEHTPADATEAWAVLSAPSDTTPTVAYPDAPQTWAAAAPTAAHTAYAPYRIPDYGAAPAAGVSGSRPYDSASATWGEPAQTETVPFGTASAIPSGAAPTASAPYGASGWGYPGDHGGAAASALYGAPGWGYRGENAAAPASAPSFVAPYTVPVSAGWRPPSTTSSRAVGVVALVLALVAAIGAPIVGGITAWIVGEAVGAQIDTAVPTRGFTDLSILSPVRDIVLVGEIAFWTGTVIGAWAIGQGIVAIAKRRGRGFGVAAVIVAVLGLGIFILVAWLAFFVGLSTGAATGTVS